MFIQDAQKLFRRVISYAKVTQSGRIYLFPVDIIPIKKDRNSKVDDCGLRWYQMWVHEVDTSVG